MNQRKIGCFLKDLRKEKGITQEQFAETLGVSGRTVSRWETGNNMPDISLLVEIAELFDVSIPEIINGERKSERMNEEVKEVAESLSDYASVEKEKMIKEIRIYSIMGMIATVIYCVLDLSGLVLQNVIYKNISMYCETLVFVMIIMTFAHTSGWYVNIQRRQNASAIHSKIRTFPKLIQAIIAAIVALVGAIVIKLILNGIF